MANLFNGNPASHADANPGAPGNGSGPRWATGFHDHLKLPSGATIGQTDNEKLRSQLARLGIEGANTEGRNIICARYAAVLQRVFDEAGNAAVTAFLESKKG